MVNNFLFGMVSTTRGKRARAEEVPSELHTVKPPSPSPAATSTSSMTEQGNRFRNSIARGKYQLLRKHHILGERRINFNDLVELCPIVREVIDAQGWEPLVACAVPACLDIVRELYANMYEVHEDSFKTYLRGKDLYIDAEVIDTF